MLNSNLRKRTMKCSNRRRLWDQERVPKLSVLYKDTTKFTRTEIGIGQKGNERKKFLRMKGWANNTIKPRG